MSPTSQAGYDAAEKFGLPTVVTGSVPLSLFLMLAGYGQYNLQWNVPAESMGPLFPERMSLMQRLINPYLKRQIPKGMSAIFLPPRNAVRAGLGLSPLTGGPGELEGRAPRVLYMDGITWDLVSGIGLLQAVCCTAWDSVLVHGWSRTCSCGTSPTTSSCHPVRRCCIAPLPVRQLWAQQQRHQQYCSAAQHSATLHC